MPFLLPVLLFVPLLLLAAWVLLVQLSAHCDRWAIALLQARGQRPLWHLVGMAGILAGLAWALVDILRQL